MGLIEAIKTVLFRKYFSFSNRAQVMEFRWYAIFAFTVVWLFNSFLNTFDDLAAARNTISATPVGRLKPGWGVNVFFQQ